MNKPLTIEQLKALPIGDWVWIINKENNKGYYAIITAKCKKVFAVIVALTTELPIHYFYDYGTRWLAYKNKEQAEGEYNSLAVENEVLKRDIENYERTIEEISTALYGANIIIDADGNVNDSRVEEAKKQTAKAIIGELKGEMAIATYTFNPMLANELKTIYLRLEKEYGVEVDE